MNAFTSTHTNHKSKLDISSNENKPVVSLSRAKPSLNQWRHESTSHSILIVTQEMVVIWFLPRKLLRFNSSNSPYAHNSGTALKYNQNIYKRGTKVGSESGNRYNTMLRTTIYVSHLYISLPGKISPDRFILLSSLFQLNFRLISLLNE